MKAKDAMTEFLGILDNLDDEERHLFLEGIHTAFFDPLGRRILAYLTKEDELTKSQECNAE